MSDSSTSSPTGDQSRPKIAIRGRRKTDIRLPINILDDRGEATEARMHRRSKFQEEFMSLPFEDIESKTRVGLEKVYFIYLLTGMKGRDQQYNGNLICQYFDTSRILF
jgi:hypothetical protein